MRATDCGVNVCLAPQVFLVAGPSVNLKGFDAFLADAGAPNWLPSGSTSDGEAVVEMAGRQCYNSYKNPRPGGTKAYLSHIIESGHGSVLAHANWTLAFTGVSRNVIHETLRHLIGTGISELSQRFVDCSDISFVVPPAFLPYRSEWLRKDGPAFCYYWKWLQHCKDALGEYRAWADGLEKRYAKEDYDRYLGASKGPFPPMTFEAWSQNKVAPFNAQEGRTARRKLARQAARDVLPGCAETRVFWTANARAIRNVIEQRCSRHADVGIRKLFNLVYNVMKDEAVHLFSDYTETPLPDGTTELTTPNRKV